MKSMIRKALSAGAVHSVPADLPGAPLNALFVEWKQQSVS
jgi:predicted membrane protein